MARRQRLSETRVKNAKSLKTKRKKLHCGETPGFYVEVTPSGHKACYWYRRSHGQEWRIKLADFGELEFEDIRALAARCNQALKQGDDPRTAVRGDSTAMTVAEAWAMFVPETGWSDRTVKENGHLWKRHIKPAIGERHLDSITSGDIAALLARAANQTSVRIGDSLKMKNVGGPVASNRARAALSALFSWAIERGFVEVNPVSRTKPRKERPRDRVLRADDVQPLMSALDQSPSDFRDVVLLILFTACRRGEILGLRWDEVTIGGPAPRLTIPPERSKARRTREVPLIPQAVEVLERRKKGAEGDHVFPSDAAPGHLGTIKKSWAKLIKRAGIDGTVPHDLRRSVAQAALDAGADFAVVSALLGHSRSSLGTTGIYAAPSLDRQRSALERGVARLSGEENEAEVVPFAAR